MKPITELPIFVFNKSYLHSEPVFCYCVGLVFKEGIPTHETELPKFFVNKKMLISRI